MSTESVLGEHKHNNQLIEQYSQVMKAKGVQKVPLASLLSSEDLALASQMAALYVEVIEGREPILLSMDEEVWATARVIRDVNAHVVGIPYICQG